MIKLWVDSEMKDEEVVVPHGKDRCDPCIYKVIYTLKGVRMEIIWVWISISEQIGKIIRDFICHAIK